MGPTTTKYLFSTDLAEVSCAQPSQGRTSSVGSPCQGIDEVLGHHLVQESWQWPGLSRGPCEFPDHCHCLQRHLRKLTFSIARVVQALIGRENCDKVKINNESGLIQSLRSLSFYFFNYFFYFQPFFNSVVFAFSSGSVRYLTTTRVSQLSVWLTGSSYPVFLCRVRSALKASCWKLG